MVSEDKRLYDEAVQLVESEVESVISNLEDLADSYHFEREWVVHKFREIFNRKVKE